MLNNKKSAVGVISAIAVPFYKSYTERAKVAAAYTAFNALADQVVAYYNKTGNYPSSVADIGLTPGSGPISTPEPASVSEFVVPPYLAMFSLDSLTPAAPGQCAYFNVQGYIPDLNAPYTGMSADNTLQINRMVYDVNGTLVSFCIYNVIVGGSYLLEAQSPITNCILNTDDAAMQVIIDRIDELNATCS